MPSSRSTAIPTSSLPRRSRATIPTCGSSRTPPRRARENITAPWYNEWDRFTQQQIQNTLLRQIKPLEALQASAKKARELKKAG